MLAKAALLSSAIALSAAGTWTTLPAAPSAVLPSASVWTGKQVVVVGRRPFATTAVAETYDPAAKRWTQLTPPAKLGSDPGCCSAVWTGKVVLVWGAFSGAVYNPATNTWRSLRRSIQGGMLAWDGREALAWGGGCCGDARSTGSAYNPATGVFRTLPRSPLAPDQSPVGAWTGRELVLFVSGTSPDGRPYPPSFARGAAYNPATNRWRRLAAMPARGGRAVWDGHELLVVGTHTALAFDPAKNHWRRLVSAPIATTGASAVWTGKRVFLWARSRGAADDPKTNRWTVLPSWPLRIRDGSTVVWTGSSLIVWGGEIGTPVGTSNPPKFPLDGAAFTPEVK